MYFVLEGNDDTAYVYNSREDLINQTIDAQAEGSDLSDWKVWIVDSKDFVNISVETIVKGI